MGGYVAGALRLWAEFLVTGLAIAAATAALRVALARAQEARQRKRGGE